MEEEKGSPETGDFLRKAHACCDKPIDIQDAPFLTCHDKHSLATTSDSSPAQLFSLPRQACTFCCSSRRLMFVG